MSREDTRRLFDLDQFWTKNADEYMKQIPLVSSPYYFLLIIATVFVSASLIKFFRSKSTNIKDVRPLLLIYNGFLFGVFGVGVLMFLVASNFASFVFSCSKSHDFLPLDKNNELTIKHLVYTYMAMKLLSLGTHIVAAFTGRIKPGKKIKESSSKALVLLNIEKSSDESLIASIHQSVWITLLSFYFVFNPVGETLFEAIMDCCNLVVNYGISILIVVAPTVVEQTSKNGKKTSQEFVPNYNLEMKIRNFSRFVSFALISCHTYYILNNYTNCQPPYTKMGEGARGYHPTMALVIFVYSAIVAIGSLFRLFETSKVPSQVSESGKRRVNTRTATTNDTSVKYRRVTRLSKLASREETSERHS